MKKFVLSMVFILLSANAWAGGNISLLVGGAILSGSDWKPVNGNLNAGMIFDFHYQNWPFNIALDTLATSGYEDSYDKGKKAKITGATLEHHIGLRKIWRLGDSKIRASIGGGVAFIRAKLKRGAYYDSKEACSCGDGVGSWLGTGVYLDFSDFAHLGIDLRYSKAKVELYGVEREAAGLHGGLFIGATWK